METAKIWGKRSTCPRSNAACVIAREGRILSIGYVGAPKGQKHCYELGCEVEKETGSCIRGIHDAINAIGFAAKRGISIGGASFYTTLSPCFRCSQAIVASGIKKVVYLKEHWDVRGLNYLEDNRVLVVDFNFIKDKSISVEEGGE
jgi:dCMP deaminase